MAAAGGAERYARCYPEQTLLYRIVEQYYSAFVSQMAGGGLAWRPEDGHRDL